jgi:hypothetical protein
MYMLLRTLLTDWGEIRYEASGDYDAAHVGVSSKSGKVKPWLLTRATEMKFARVP